MRLDASDLASMLGLLTLLVLALPKRDWRSIPVRFRETSGGRRHHLFGPPGATGHAAGGLRARSLQLVRAELRRAFELGIPLLIAAWHAADRGAEARRMRDADWRESRQGLLFRHLSGEMNVE